MQQQRLRATFMRGGTSKALMLHQTDLPDDRADWAPIFLAAMGSPDGNGRQLDGMGGGISSLSKVCVIGAPSRSDADVDYTFAQISVTSPVVDYSANCGNMSSAVGPFAVDEGMIPTPNGSRAAVRIHNTNTGKIILSRFPMEDGKAAVEGDLALDGVPGTGAPIRLEFQNPGGARTGHLLPTGNAADVLDLDGAGRIMLSMVDAANPCVFVAAADVGLSGTELPAELDHNPDVLARLEAIRRHASVEMGLASDLEEAAGVLGVPKVGVVTQMCEVSTLSGRTLTAADADILVRMISVGQPHQAVPLTGALCLAAACRVPGSVPYRLMKEAARTGSLRIAHPSGVLLVDAEIEDGVDGVSVRQASVYRTARRLFAGEVYYRIPRARAA